jgi:hypothetical protein
MTCATGWRGPGGPTSCPASAGITASRSITCGSWPRTGDGYDWRVHEARGAAMEVPDLLVGDVREFFRPLRLS